MTYFCSRCNEEHEQWPVLHFTAPDFYRQLTEEQRANAMLTPDRCVISHGDRTDRFLYGVMQQKVNDHCRDLQYGLWVSVNEDSFRDFTAHLDDPGHKAQYFGWLSNKLPGYEKFDWVKMHIAADHSDELPARAFVQVVNNPDIPLVRDYFQGISLEAAQARIKRW